MAAPTDTPNEGPSAEETLGASVVDRAQLMYSYSTPSRLASRAVRYPAYVRGLRPLTSRSASVLTARSSAGWSMTGEAAAATEGAEEGLGGTSEPRPRTPITDICLDTKSGSAYGDPIGDVWRGRSKSDDRRARRREECPSWQGVVGVARGWRNQRVRVVARAATCGVVAGTVILARGPLRGDPAATVIDVAHRRDVPARHNDERSTVDDDGAAATAPKRGRRRAAATATTHHHPGPGPARPAGGRGPAARATMPAQCHRRLLHGHQG